MATEEQGPDPGENGQGAEIALVETKYVYGAYILVAVGGAIALWLSHRHEVTIEVTEGFAAFAVVYIVAQGVERFIQPLTHLLGKPQEKKAAKGELAVANGNRTLALMEEDGPRATIEEGKAIGARKALDVIQAERAVLFWAIATFVALVACGALDLGLIGGVADVTGAGDTDEAPQWFRDVDVLVTGVVIGAGTKPLHDLIDLIQSKKEKADPAAGGSTT